MKKETRSRETSLCLQPSSASCCYCQLRIKIPKQGQVDPKIPLLGERSTLCPDEQQVDLDRDCTFLLLRELPLIPEMSSWPRDSWRCTYMSTFIHLVDKEVDIARWYSNVLSILELAHNSCCIYEDSMINFLVDNHLKIWRYSTLILRMWSFRLRNLSWNVNWVVLLEFFLHSHTIQEKLNSFNIVFSVALMLAKWFVSGMHWHVLRPNWNQGRAQLQIRLRPAILWSGLD